MMENRLDNPQIYNEMVKKNVDSLQAYADENGIMATDYEALER